MKAILASSVETEREVWEAFSGLLEPQGFSVERLQLTPIESSVPLHWIASMRLLQLQGAADVLFCLDPEAAVLKHTNKYVCLIGASVGLPTPGSYLGNVVIAGMREARAAFAGDGTAEKLKSFHLRRVVPVDFESLTSGSSGRFGGRAALLKALRS